SRFAHEILTAKPYAFLDDAPLEERRTQAVYARRALAPRSAAEIGALDAAAIERVREEARTEARDADELHDALLTCGFLTGAETGTNASTLLDELINPRRVAHVRLRPPAGDVWVAAERLPELKSVCPEAAVDGSVAVPA